MASGSKTGTQVYFSFLSKVPENEPLQVPQQGPCKEKGPPKGHFAYLSETLSFRFPSKGSSLKVPLMESLTDRCPTTRALLHSSIKVLGIRAPLLRSRFPSTGKGLPRRCPHLETFSTYLSWSPVKELPPSPPPWTLFKGRDASSPEAPSSISQSPQ